ncbi:MAG TPA: hypothetical protein DCX27_08095 [Balneola sp.]|nr:hypothetical protein [Balneola sp.]
MDNRKQIKETTKMSCLIQHKTKEELSNWLMENASDNETTGFLDMLAGDIWDMMNGETDYKSLYEAEVEITHMKTEVNYSLGRAIHKQREKNKQLQEENKKLKEGTLLKFQEVEIADLQEENKKLQEREFRMCEIANANGWDIYPTDSEEEDDIEDNDPEEYGEYTWKEGLTAEEIAKGDTIDPLTGEPIKK